MGVFEGFNMPDELYYHTEHSWAKVENGKVRVGMSDFFQQEAGNVVYVDLPEEGDEIEQVPIGSDSVMGNFEGGF